jgi:hypothetical protein
MSLSTGPKLLFILLKLFYGLSSLMPKPKISLQQVLCKILHGSTIEQVSLSIRRQQRYSDILLWTYKHFQTLISQNKNVSSYSVWFRRFSWY